MNRLLVAQGLACQTIERRIDGINLEELEEQFKSGKIKFSIPFLVSTILLVIPILIRKKRAILDLANQYGVYIVEDDYLGDLDSKRDKPSTIWILRIGSFISSPSQPVSFQPFVLPLILPNALKRGLCFYKISGL